MLLLEMVRQIPEGPAMELFEHYLRAKVEERAGVRNDNLGSDIETWMKQYPGEHEKVLELIRARG